MPLFQLQRPLLEVAVVDTQVQTSVHPQPEVVAGLLNPHDAGSHPLSRAILEPTSLTHIHVLHKQAKDNIGTSGSPRSATVTIASVVHD